MADMQKIKQLRELTQAGLGDCKKALEESGDDLDNAIKWLREKGKSIAGKKASRSANEGLVHSYIHPPGKVGVMLEINCESDFVAKHEDFVSLANDICMHVAAISPRYLSPDDVSEDDLAKEREIFRNQTLQEGKPEHIVDKIIDGRMRKFYEENCLLKQSFVKDPDKSIEQLVTESIAKFGENIKINRFVRYQVGEAA